jgi:hypothetical protein
MPLCRTRLLAAPITAIALLGLAACGGGDADTATTSAPAGTRLDVGALQLAIAADVGHQVPDTWAVTCPKQIPLQQGLVTHCTATASDGLSTTILVTQTDATGGYTWRTEMPGGENASAPSSATSSPTSSP